MKQLSDFFPRLLVYTPACSEPLAQQALLDSAIDFCDRSCVLRYTLDPITTQVGVASYELWAPTSEYEISRVLKVHIEGEPLEPVMAEVRQPIPEDNAKPSGFYVEESDCGLSLYLNSPPDSVYTLVVEVALRPAKDAKRVDPRLYNRWMDAIVAGALSRVYMVPGQPFSDPSNGLYQAGRAMRFTNNARIEGSYGRVRGSMTIKGRPLA
jgi:hypothetical protein